MILIHPDVLQDVLYRALVKTGLDTVWARTLARQHLDTDAGLHHWKNFIHGQCSNCRYIPTTCPYFANPFYLAPACVQSGTAGACPERQPTHDPDKESP